MPSAANMSVFMADGTTSITYDLLTPAGGDGSPARWRQDTGQPTDVPSGARPSFQISTTDNGPKTARKVHAKYVYPSAIEDANGQWSVKDRALFEFTAVIPNAIPPVVLAELVQGLRLLATDPVKSAITGGYAPV